MFILSVATAERFSRSKVRGHNETTALEAQASTLWSRGSVVLRLTIAWGGGECVGKRPEAKYADLVQARCDPSHRLPLRLDGLVIDRRRRQRYRLV